MPHQHTREAHKVTLIGAALDTLLGVAKIIVGWFSQSHALIADGIHSLSDLLTDALVIIATHYGRQAPDKEHPYGHARFETLGTLILSSILIAVAGAIAYDSLLRLLNAENLQIPTWPALVVAAISIVSKEWIFRYTLHIANKMKSDLLKANAWHSRSDALSSIVVFIGIGGSMLGIQWLDQIAAFIVGLMIAHIGWKLMSDSLKDLLDTALPEEETRSIIELASQIKEVKGVHSLRSRKIGALVFLDIHLQVNPTISVSEGHQIGMKVITLLHQHDLSYDITFHIDAEDDSRRSYHDHPALPLRQELLLNLQQAWQPLGFVPDPSQLVLHYLNHKVDIDLYLNSTLPEDINQTDLVQPLTQYTWLGELRLWKRYHTDP
ncbi:cation diffusion facilitator family transporter [Oceanospirillum beijerinckii]|uniref:cation diffusion facilitator family transporter n=1 Tax=Oceanospirillum beijerinckii TaxID=64976 RepID=UPI0004226287|nr:cation diffusion facilitator family transporter [Oceanospirillum beijerinckii]